MSTREQPSQILSRSKIYRYLYEADHFCSRQALAQACDFSMPTVSQALSSLEEDGLIQYDGLSESTGGRRARGIKIVPDARYAIGVSVTEQHLRIIAADLCLHELAYERTDFSTDDHILEDVNDFISYVNHFLETHDLDRERLLGVGVTIPGLISPDGTTIYDAPPLGIRNKALHQFLDQAPFPIHVENDGSSSGHAEWFARKMPENMVYLSLETGVGGAVLIDGKPYHGANRRSGEFGHICVEPGGLQCSCGRRGCLEAYCTMRRIRNDLGVSYETFFHGLELHLPEYEALWFDILRHLAIGINAIRLSLDCDIILGGLLTEYLPPWLFELKKYVVSGNPFEQNGDFVQLSTLRKHIAPLGAALYFIREFVEGV